MNVTIRQGASADADAIADLIASVEPRLLVNEISRDQRRENFSHLLDSGFNVSFLAEANGRLVGELTLALGNPNPTQLGFGVHPGWRRRGVGRQLLAHALRWASESGIHKLVAEVPAHNVAAIGLLKEAGFSEEAYLVSHFRRTNGSIDDAVLLARTPS